MIVFEHLDPCPEASSCQKMVKLPPLYYGVVSLGTVVLHLGYWQFFFPCGCIASTYISRPLYTEMTFMQLAPFDTSVLPTNTTNTTLPFLYRLPYIYIKKKISYELTCCLDDWTKAEPQNSHYHHHHPMAHCQHCGRSVVVAWCWCG